VATFNDAQSAWDAYRKHLIEQGFLAFRKVGSHHASMQQYLTVRRSVGVVGYPECMVRRLVASEK